MTKKIFTKEKVIETNITKLPDKGIKKDAMLGSEQYKHVLQYLEDMSQGLQELLKRRERTRNFLKLVHIPVEKIETEICHSLFGAIEDLANKLKTDVETRQELQNEFIESTLPHCRSGDCN